MSIISKYPWLAAVWKKLNVRCLYVNKKCNIPLSTSFHVRFLLSYHGCIVQLSRYYNFIVLLY